MEGNFHALRHPRKLTNENLLSTKILTPLKQTAARGRGNFRGNASVLHETREYLRSVRPGSGIERDRVLVHLPRKVSRVCTLFPKKSGGIHCRVTGRQRYLVDLLQDSVSV